MRSRSLSEISQDIQKQIDIDPRQRPHIYTVCKVFGSILAGVVYLLYRFLERMAKNFFPTTADEEYLNIWGEIFRIQRKPATHAAVEVVLQWEPNVYRSGHPSDIKIKSQNGNEYIYDYYVSEYGEEYQEYCYTSDSESNCSKYIFKAREDGDIESLKVGDTMFLTETRRDIKTECKVAQFFNGVDIEPLEEYRARITKRFTTPLRGGTDEDYRFWLSQVEGCTDPYVFPCQVLENHVFKDRAGCVSLAYLCKRNKNIFPSKNELQEAMNKLGNKRPLTAKIIMVELVPARKAIVIATKEIINQLPLATINEKFKAFLIERARPNLGLTLNDIQSFLTVHCGLPYSGALTFTELKIKEDEVLVDGEFITANGRQV